MAAKERRYDGELRFEKLDAAIHRMRNHRVKPTDDGERGATGRDHLSAWMESQEVSSPRQEINLETAEVDELASVGYVKGYAAGVQDFEYYLLRNEFPPVRASLPTAKVNNPGATPNRAGHSRILMLQIFRDGYREGYTKGKLAASEVLTDNNFDDFATKLRLEARKTEY